jgi:hypothetical protein
MSKDFRYCRIYNRRGILLREGDDLQDCLV